MAATARAASANLTPPVSRASVHGLIVKVAELCNLNCKYCYIYNHEDKTYLTRPKLMGEDVFEQLLRRIREYCERHAPHAMSITLHGGEPTLLGPRRLSAYARRAREVLGKSLDYICMQTNGTLLTDEWLEVFRENRIPVSVSLDGPSEVNDRNRIDHQGKGSHELAIRGLRLLQKAGFKPGVLCVIDPFADGLQNYRYLRSLGVTSIDFLFPDVSWDSKQRWYGAAGETPVADYLIPVFDEWFAEDNPDVRVRVLWGLLSSLMGGTHSSDAFGNPLMAYLLIETNGSIQALDALRVCEEGLCESGLNVATHGFDDLEQGLPLVHQLVTQALPLCNQCRSCPEVAVCGGGYVPHRYKRGRGFDNPSVWCADILRLISHLRRAAGLPRRASVSITSAPAAARTL